MICAVRNSDICNYDTFTISAWDLFTNIMLIIEENKVTDEILVVVLVSKIG